MAFQVVGAYPIKAAEDEDQDLELNHYKTESQL